ncbi:ABC-three component system middle component 5 [Jannaschia pagri]|uniref:ABC-three component system middle component 5 n=1 Tax=Jannaschia TaxID=188905 RepID=UPI003570D7DD
MSIPRASLLDTFLLFPEYLYEIQYQGFGSLRSSLRDLNIPKPSDSFVSLPDIRTAFRELQVFQKAALRQLVAKNILSADAFKEGNLTLSPRGIPAELNQVLHAFVTENSRQLTFITEGLSDIPLDGPSGLLRRTNLELGGRFR